MAKFRIEDLDRTISQDARDAICDLILAWASLDTAISYWFGLAFNLDMDMMSILTGNMDTKTKLEKMRAASEHMGHSELAKGIKQLSSNHRQHADIRNIIAHRRCIGMVRGEGQQLAFTSTKHVKGEPGQFELVILTIEQINAAAFFANH